MNMKDLYTDKGIQYLSPYINSAFTNKKASLKRVI